MTCVVLYQYGDGWRNTQESRKIYGWWISEYLLWNSLVILLSHLINNKNSSRLYHSNIPSKYDSDMIIDEMKRVS